jgi:hypothetical protein
VTFYLSQVNNITSHFMLCIQRKLSPKNLRKTAKISVRKQIHFVLVINH